MFRNSTILNYLRFDERFMKIIRLRCDSVAHSKFRKVRFEQLKHDFTDAIFLLNDLISVADFGNEFCYEQRSCFKAYYKLRVSFNTVYRENLLSWEPLSTGRNTHPYRVQARKICVSTQF